MHPAKKQILHWFKYEHLPMNLQVTSKKFYELAWEEARSCEGPEVTVALRKLLEAKDAAVRATIGNPIPPEAREQEDNS